MLLRARIDHKPHLHIQPHIDVAHIYLMRGRDFYPTYVGGSLFQGILYAGTVATILIIDDEESVRTLLRFALEVAGYEVTEAANGRQGLGAVSPEAGIWSSQTLPCPS